MPPLKGLCNGGGNPCWTRARVWSTDFANSLLGRQYTLYRVSRRKVFIMQDNYGRLWNDWTDLKCLDNMTVDSLNIQNWTHLGDTLYDVLLRSDLIWRHTRISIIF